MKSVILTPRSGVMQIRESQALREPRFHPPGRMFRKARTSPGREGPESLRVFGCLPVTARGAARRQASEKPRRRKPRGGVCAGGSVGLLLLKARRFNAALVASDEVPFAALAEREGVSPSYFTSLVLSASAISRRISPVRFSMGGSRAI